MIESIQTHCHRGVFGSGAEGGRVRGPLHGIPIFSRTTSHCRPDDDDRRLDRAGSSIRRRMHSSPPSARRRVVLLGKANSASGRISGPPIIEGWRARGGQAKNPYVLDRIRAARARSGGGWQPIFARPIGTETDGSIVCPRRKRCCRHQADDRIVSRTGIIPIAHSQDTAGPMRGR